MHDHSTKKEATVHDPWDIEDDASPLTRGVSTLGTRRPRLEPISMSDGYTIRSDPPTSRKRKRYSRWAEVLDECRKFPGEWRQVAEPMKKAAAMQTASDIRNAHRRDPDRMFTGIKPGERWSAEWDGTDEKAWLWIKFDGPIDR